MTMIKGLSKEDSLMMLMEVVIYDNGYLFRTTAERKLELLESLILMREQVSPLNRIRVRRAIRIVKQSIIEFSMVID